MKRERTILRIVLIIVELLFIVAVIISPFPSMIGISGIVWRIVIGLIGCSMLAMGIRRKAKCIYEAS